MNATAGTQTILIVEDEADLVRVLEYNLRQAGYATRATSSAREGLALARTLRPSAVLLDVMLPDGLGTEVCRKLRADPLTRDVPVVMLTARGEEIDRVVGFELGADDYITKPFSVRELVLRVRAVLGRGRSATAEDALLVGLLRVEPAAQRVYVDGREVQLTALEFRLLTTLAQRLDRVQTRETLLADVWGIHLAVETRTVDTQVKRLREKLGVAGAYVQTIRGMGYRFSTTAPATAESDA
jgi:two-component system phosphate regulon response regulator PhoB